MPVPPTIPYYNTYTVPNPLDLIDPSQSYVNAAIESGYFDGSNVYLGKISQGKWSSIPTVLNTNNGIATPDASGGLTILTPGIYKISLSVFPTQASSGQSTVTFNYGTRLLVDASNAPVSAFGGACPTGMFTYGNNNPQLPGIVNWITTGMDTGAAAGAFVANPTTYELAYNYNVQSNAAGNIYNGICTTEMTFNLTPQSLYDSSVNLVLKPMYFNVYTTSTNGLKIGKCYFTLQLVSTVPLPYYPPIPTPTPTITWTQSSDASNNANWTAITSDEYETNLYAVINPGGIYKSSNSGANWVIQGNGAPSSASWSSIATNSTGQNIYACANNGPVWIGINGGTTWSQVPTNQVAAFNWYSIATNSTGSYVAVCGYQTNVASQKIYTSNNSGSTFTINTGSDLTMTGATYANCIASSRDLSGNYPYLYCATTDLTGATPSNNGGIFKNISNGTLGTAWTRVFTTSKNYSSITTNKTGQFVYAAVGTTAGSTPANQNGFIYKSSDYGSNWIQTIDFSSNWTDITTDDTGQIVMATAYNKGIYMSRNGGVTWTQTNYNIYSWKSIASSYDGLKASATTQSSTTPNGIWNGVYS